MGNQLQIALARASPDSGSATTTTTVELRHHLLRSMPAQMRPLETTTPSASPPPPLEEVKADDLAQGSENHSQEQADKCSDSDGSSYSSAGEKDEFIVVKLAEVRKEVQCPICLGIIRKTRTVMECLHRFCRECIDKSMRLGNNECPACRTHCASRRSLRDDPNYDALIAALYPDIDIYEEEELAFNEEEKARNKQIQDLIAETFRRQAEELGKKKTSSKAFSKRHRNYRNLRVHRNHRLVEQGSDEEEEANEHDGSKDSCSADERWTEIKSKRQKRWRGARHSQQSSGANADDDNVSESNRDLSAAFVAGTEIRAWGKGGLRSNTQHGGLHWANGKLSRNNRVSRLVDRIRCSSENDLTMNISLTLLSLNEENIPSVKRPYLSCSHTSSVKHLCQYVAMQTSVETSDIEMLIVKNFNPVNNSSTSPKGLGVLNPCCQTESQLLSEHQTLGEIQANFTQQNLVLAYRRKAQSQEN